MRLVRNERGVALMLVLWLIVVLAAIAVTVVAAAREEVNTVTNLRARTVARYAAESGVVVARSALSQAFAAARPEQQVLVFPRVKSEFENLGDQALGQARYQVALLDLNARIDLNQADQATLQNFLQQFVDQSAARDIAASLLDYRDPDNVPYPNGGEADAYAAAGSPYTPANRPLQNIEEVIRVRGITEAIAAEIAPFITVWGDRRINVNSAPEQVLMALPGLSRAGADAIVSRRSGAGPITSLVELGSIPGIGVNPQQQAMQLPIGLIPTRVLVVSRGWQPGHPLTHEIQAVLEISGLVPGTVPTLTVRHWIERDR